MTWLEMRVADTGVGIPEANLPTVFRPFLSQVKGAEKAGLKNAGVGLGLALTKAIVELLGGTIEIASSEGQGTQVTLRIPLAEVSADDPAADPDGRALGAWWRLPLGPAEPTTGGAPGAPPLRVFVALKNRSLRAAMTSAIGPGAQEAEILLPEENTSAAATAAAGTAAGAAAVERLLERLVPGPEPAILVVSSQQLRRLRGLGGVFPHPRVFVLVVVSFDEGDVAVQELAPLPCLRRPLKPTVYVARVEEIRAMAAGCCFRPLVRVSGTETDRRTDDTTAVACRRIALARAAGVVCPTERGAASLSSDQRGPTRD